MPLPHAACDVVVHNMLLPRSTRYIREHNRDVFSRYVSFSFSEATKIFLIDQYSPHHLHYVTFHVLYFSDERHKL